MASNQTISACATCNKSSTEAALKRCSNCRNVQYCSRECQKANWKTHKKWCEDPDSIAHLLHSVSGNQYARDGAERTKWSTLMGMGNGQLTEATNAAKDATIAGLDPEALTQLQYIPGVIEIGPVTTVGEVLNAQPGPKPAFQDRLYNPTPRELYKHCTEIFANREKAKKDGEQAEKQRTEEK